MHELSLAQAIIEVVEQETRQAGATRVVRVVLSLGELAGVMEDQLGFCFPLAAHGTLVEGAELEFERVEGRARCPDCGQEFHLPTFLTPCPNCGGFSGDICAGQELRVARLEVE